VAPDIKTPMLKLGFFVLAHIEFLAHMFYINVVIPTKKMITPVACCLREMNLGKYEQSSDKSFGTSFFHRGCINVRYLWRTAPPGHRQHFAYAVGRRYFALGVGWYSAYVGR